MNITGATEPAHPPLDSIAIQIGPISLAWYGILIGCATVIGLLLAIREGRKRHGVPSDVFMDLLLYALPAAIIGARLYYVAFEWEYYSQHPEHIIAIWRGGLAIHGGLIGAVIGSVWYAHRNGFSFWKLADIVAPSILLGQAIGRWGNFMNQEAHGGVVSREFLEGLYIPEFIIRQMEIYNPAPGQGLEAAYYFHHPTFLYESLWSLVGVVILLALRRLNLRTGEIFFTYFIWYSFGRFFIEGLRTDSLMIGDVIQVAQLMSVVLIIGSIMAIIYRRRTGNERYLDIDQAMQAYGPHKKQAAHQGSNKGGTKKGGAKRSGAAKKGTPKSKRKK